MNSKVRMTFEIDEENYCQLEKEKKETGASMTFIVNKALKIHFNNKEA